MDDSNAVAEQRMRVIRWHNAVCPDGSTNRNASWKSRLAELLDVKPATITNLCVPRPEGGPRSRKSKVMSGLAEVEDEEFGAIFGFQAASVRAVGGLTAGPGLLLSINSEDEYADLCLANDIQMKPVARTRAEKRIDEKRARERDNRAGWRAEDKACWFQPISGRDDGPLSRQVPMHESEMDAVSKVAAVLFDGPPTSSVTIVQARPYSGIAHSLQRFLADEPRFDSYYRGGIHHLHLDAVGPGQSVGRILIQQVLHDELQDDAPPNPVELAKRLANHLFTQERLLIIHGATSMQDDTLLKHLSWELAARARTHHLKGVSRLLLTCWSVGAFSDLNNGRPRRVDYDPTIATGAMTYFEEALRYYLEVRRSLPDATKAPVDGSVIKLLEQHYEARLDAFTEVPSAVRFRAFCASDIGAPAPFDPTQGIWPRVDARLGGLIPEIAGCLGDVQSHVQTLGPNRPSDGRGDELRMLRVVSTGLFFFTQAMLSRLQVNPISREYLRDASLERMSSTYVHVEPASDGRGYVATMPLLVRSLLQDDWMRREPESHCAVHQALGETLYEMAEADDQFALQQELPYPPPRGHVRIALALECIRHFMRAARTAAVYIGNTPRAEKLTQRALEAYDRFLEHGVFPSASGMDANSSVSAKLARAYGLHGLKYEVLCLLSEDGRGHQAPRGLPAQQASVFFRELGITLTRMLRPAEALAAFRLALGVPGMSVETSAYVNAHAVVASLVLGDNGVAREFLRAARSAEGDPTIRKDLHRSIVLRNDAREAAIELAEGEIDIAVMMWDRLAVSGLVPFWGDRVIGYLDTHLAAGYAEPGREAVWKVAEQAANKARNDGLEHERLRVEIRRATICRLLGYPGVAEAILDQVGLDLARHGGDELVFREFQIESAETLAALGRPRYAFAAYAWPCFVALRHGQAKPWTERARTACLTLLEKIARGVPEVLPSLEDHPFWKVSESIDRSLAHPFFSVDLLPPIKRVDTMLAALAQEEARLTFRTSLDGNEKSAGR